MPQPCPYANGGFRGQDGSKTGLFACPYERKVFRECVYPLAKPLAGVLRWVRRSHFDSDLELIRAVADCTTLEELRTEVIYQHHHRPTSGFWRGLMRVRVSGQRLVNLGAELLPATSSAPENVFHPRFVEVESGKVIPDVCREQNISEVSSHGRERESGQLKVNGALRLRELKRENDELKRVLADTLLKYRILEETCGTKVNARHRREASPDQF